jgi:RES domain-containing protein
LERETALAEAAYYIALQPIRPRARRRIYRLNVALSSVIDLSDWDQLVTLGLSRGSLQSIDHADCQIIGGAVEWLRHDGLLVPSGRSEGTNLVIFPNRQGPDYEFEVLDFEEV